MCDLTHSNKVLASDNVPLGIGMLAAYSKKCLGAKYEFGLYKEPHSLDEDLEAFSPHVLALSNYVWNERISLQFARHVKKFHPNIVTVFGGPNYPFDFTEREKFLKAHPEIGRAEALRRSMFALAANDDYPYRAHPAFWAPFVVVGEGARR